MALRLGVFQIRMLERIPSHAAVDQSVELVKKAGKSSAVGLVNAVLRKVNQQPVKMPGTAEYSTPEWLLMGLTINCHEDWARIRTQKTEELSAGSYLKYSDVRALTVPENVCAVMPPPPAKALYGRVKNSSVPVLLVNGEADPQDPPANVAAAKKRYPNSLALVAPGQGHSYTGIACRVTILTDFFERGSVAGLNKDCLEKVQLPEFVISKK